MSSAFLAPIVSPRVDIIFGVLSFVTGLLDATIYNAFSVFASMQTGNTIFLGLGASQQPLGKPFGWLKSLLSIASFAAGASTTGRLSTAFPQHYAPTARGTLTVVFLVQVALVVLAAGLGAGHVLPEHARAQGEFAPEQLGMVAMLAFQAGSQMAASRLLGVKEMPTTVLTSVIADLVMDPQLLQTLFSPRQLARNRRIGTIVPLLVGAICGGWITKSRAGVAGALWVIAGIKTLVAVGWWAYSGKALGPVKERESKEAAAAAVSVEDAALRPVEDAKEKMEV